MITFPSNPQSGDVFTSGDRQWTYNAAKNAWIGGTSVITPAAIGAVGVNDLTLTNERVPTSAGMVGKIEATENTAAADTDKLATVQSSTLKWLSLTRLWTWALNKIQTTALVFSARPACSVTTAPGTNDLLRLADGDARYGQVISAIKISDTSRSSADTGTTYVVDPHLQIALTPGVWMVDAIQAWNNTVPGGGMKARLNYSGTWDTSDSFWSSVYFYTSNSNTEGSAFYSYGKTMTNPQALLALSFQSASIRITAQIKVTTSGTLSIEWGQNVSSATPTTYPKGSYLIARRIA
jgi:hypothetical protein